MSRHGVTLAWIRTSVGTSGHQWLISPGAALAACTQCRVSKQGVQVEQLLAWIHYLKSALVHGPTWQAYKYFARPAQTQTFSLLSSLACYFQSFAATSLQLCLMRAARDSKPKFLFWFFLASLLLIELSALIAASYKVFAIF